MKIKPTITPISANIDHEHTLSSLCLWLLLPSAYDKYLRIFTTINDWLSEIQDNLDSHKTTRKIGAKVQDSRFVTRRNRRNWTKLRSKSLYEKVYEISNKAWKFLCEFSWNNLISCDSARYFSIVIYPSVKVTVESTN